MKTTTLSVKPLIFGIGNLLQPLNGEGGLNSLVKTVLAKTQQLQSELINQINEDMVAYDRETVIGIGEGTVPVILALIVPSAEVPYDSNPHEGSASTLIGAIAEQLDGLAEGRFFMTNEEDLQSPEDIRTNMASDVTQVLVDYDRKMEAGEEYDIFKLTYLVNSVLAPGDPRLKVMERVYKKMNGIDIND